MEFEAARKATLLSKWSALNYWPIATKRTLFAAHACKVRVMKFKEKPCNANRNTTEKALSSPSEVPLLIDRSQPKLCILYSMKDQEDSSNSTRDNRKDTFFFQVNSSYLLTDRNQNYNVFKTF